MGKKVRTTSLFQKPSYNLVAGVGVLGRLLQSSYMANDCNIAWPIAGSGMGISARPQKVGKVSNKK